MSARLPEKPSKRIKLQLMLDAASICTRDLFRSGIHEIPPLSRSEISNIDTNVVASGVTTRWTDARFSVYFLSKPAGLFVRLLDPTS